MKLLICTQVVDKNHPILGFFHRWIEEFAKHFEEVHVICLFKGEFDLPKNVHVYSLGKEEGENKMKYVWRFYKNIWALRNNYNNVFVHMNQVYILLGGLLWRFWGKKIGLWYMHKSVAGGLRYAEKLAHVIFTASKESFRLPSDKLIITGHGIDTEIFSGTINDKDIDLITISRISRSKNIEMALQVLATLREEMDVNMTIIGGAASTDEQIYLEELKELAHRLHVDSAVTFVGPKRHDELLGFIVRSQVFLHTATNGSMDKTLLEPMLAGTPVVSSAEGAKSVPMGDWYVENIDQMVARVKQVFHNDMHERTKMLQKYVLENHSILTLVPKICKHYQ